MTVLDTDIALRYSVTSGSAGNSGAGTRDASLGKYISTTDVPTSGSNKYFDDVTSAEASAGDTEYRCIFVLNNHATDTALNVAVQIVSEVALGGTTSAALDNVAISAKGSASAQADTVANENTAPTAVGSFVTTSLSIGTLTPGQCKAFWLKRVVGASTAGITGDGFTVRVTGDG